MPGDLSATQLGNYRLVSLIGKGGMGEVWLARHPLLGREVAVKVLAPALSNDEEALARFRREALTVNQIDHSSVVEVTDFGALPDGRAYCVMELLRGQSLQRYLEDRGRLDLPDAVAILVPVIEGLAAAHSAGVVHRDVKPDNIFLDTGKQGQRVIRILDFGIAKLLDPGDDAERMTKTGQLLGTPLYMSPEQVSGEIQRVGPWSDVYSLGVLLYRMLAGRPPFVGESFGQILMQHMQAPPPSICATRADLGAGVDDVIQRAMAKQTDERFATMAELNDALMQASAHKGTAPTSLVADLDPALSATVSTPQPGSFDNDVATAPTITPADLTPLTPPEAAEETVPVVCNAKRGRGLLLALVALVVLGVGGVAIYLLARPSPTPKTAPKAAVPAPRPGPQPPAVPVGMVGVPAGCFTMGTQKGAPAESPPHRVCLASFALDHTEVTVAAYTACVKAGVCGAPTRQAKISSPDPHKKSHSNAWCNYPGGAAKSHPVNCLDWQQAQAYCRWKGRRLPTEAEWEYAARSNDGRRYPWGNDTPDCGTAVVTDARGPGCDKGGSAPVGSRPSGKGPFGAVDQAGNVREWTADCWDASFYAQCKGTCSNPLNHCAGGQKRVTRGGGFMTGIREPNAFAATHRRAHRPDGRHKTIGFRCAKSLPHGSVPGDPHADARPLPIARVKASSFLPPYQGQTYKPEHLIDGRLDTSWQPRGSKLDSKGQFVRLYFKAPATAEGGPKPLITALSVANGYQAITKGVDQFYNNSRLRMISVHFSDGTQQRAFLPPNRKGFVRLRLWPKRSKWLLLQIESIYPGKKYRDVGVSEIKVWGKP